MHVAFRLSMRLINFFSSQLLALLVVFAAIQFKEKQDLKLPIIEQ